VSSTMSSEKRVFLHFITKYYTKWGQNVVVSGPGVLFGNYDPKRCVPPSLDLQYHDSFHHHYLLVVVALHAVFDGADALFIMVLGPVHLCFTPS
jgi:hypothetical protein